jgi:hypothetical protein
MGRDEYGGHTFHGAIFARVLRQSPFSRRRPWLMRRIARWQRLGTCDDAPRVWHPRMDTCQNWRRLQ